MKETACDMNIEDLEDDIWGCRPTCISVLRSWHLHAVQLQVFTTGTQTVPPTPLITLQIWHLL